MHISSIIGYEFHKMYTKKLSAKKRLNVHICELPKTSESNLPKLPPNSNFCAHWKRNCQKLILVSVNHPLTRNFLRSYAAIAFEKRRHGRSPFWWVIHPCSDLRFCWDFIMTFIFIYIYITVPYILAFHRVAKSSDPEIWNTVCPAYLMCILDIVLNFMTGFGSPNGHEIFLDPVLITRHYLRGYFLIDFISSIHYTWFYRVRILPPGPDSNSILLIPEFLPLLKMLRIYTLRFYIRQIVTIYALSHAEETAIWLVILVLLTFHWCSCLSHLFPIIIAHILGIELKESGIYLVTAELYKRSNSEIYIMYLHIGVSNFFGSSYIEFNTLSKLDTVVRSIILLLGKAYMIYLIVIILQLVKSATEPELKYQRVLHRVKEYIHEKKLSKHLSNKLISYYEYRFQGSYFKENAILGTLSNHLNQEIMINSCRGLLDTTTIFQLLPRHVTIKLMGILKPVIYLNEDIIYKCGDDGDRMFFIVSGTVALITVDGKEICHEKDGGYFGEAAVIFSDRKRLESVITLEVCELLYLNFRDFKRMFSSSSEFYKKLENFAKERQEKINKLINDQNGYLQKSELVTAVSSSDAENKLQIESVEVSNNVTDDLRTEDKNETN